MQSLIGAACLGLACLPSWAVSDADGPPESQGTLITALFLLLFLASVGVFVWMSRRSGKSRRDE